MVDPAKIKERRLALGLTQEQAAKKAGFTDRQRWNGIERGARRRLSVDTLSAVARALECSMEDLIATKPPAKAATSKGAKGRTGGGASK